MKNKLIIFDIDATLLHSDRVDSKAFAMTYQEIFAKPFPSINWSDYPHVTDETIFETVFQQHFGRKANLEEKNGFRNQFVATLKELRKIQPQDFKEVKGARVTVQQLLDMEGYHVGIATGGWAAPAQLKLAHIGIDYNQLHCGYADGNYTREDIINQALGEAKKEIKSIDRVVYIGDAEWDVKTTKNMQIPFIGIRYQGDVEVLQQLGAKHVIQDYTNFEVFLQLLNKAEVVL